MYRIGQSRDIHRLESNNRRLIVAGVLLPFDKGPVSHSDGDVVYHALAEALLGSLALGDLGLHFPDNDKKYLDYDSSLIVKRCYEMVKNKSYQVVNVDINIILEKPRLKDYILEMRQNVASLLKTDVSNISIKAQSNEKIGEVGEGNAIEATAIILIKKSI